MCEKKFYVRTPAGGITMTDYYTGLLIGAAGGYCLSLITLLMMWALCVIAKENDNDKRETDEETGD